jgi:asparagine synthase (glutamine-hydrolysing)
MCGLNLIVDFRGNVGEASIRQMNVATQHRGPDGSFSTQVPLNNAQVFLGHNRLKIIDLSNDSNQPFFSRDKRYVLIFNGEIYNYRQLKAQLPATQHWKTNSDTEVLLYWLINHGAKGVADLEGMFAFALLDTHQQSILFGRDGAHIKPLYFHQSEHCLVVSSEIRGILASNLASKELNEEQIGHYLNFKYAQPPHTFFQGIDQLPPIAHFVIATQALKVIPQPTKPHLSSSEISNESIEQLLIESVAQQLKADVPVGIFLSGGVDSTLLLSIAQELGIKHLPSFAIINHVQDQSFGTRDFHFARLAAKQYQSIHHEYIVSPDDLKNLANWVNCMDQPIADGAALLTYLLSQKARKQVKVVLSGAGADELFAGYNRHWAFAWYLKNKRLLNAIAPYARWFSKGLSDGIAHPWRHKFRLIHKFFAQLAPSPAQTFINFTRLQGIPLRKALQFDISQEVNHHSREAWLRWCLQHDQQHYLPNDVLAVTDAMSMQHGLEVRVPYLSQALIQVMQQYSPLDSLKQGKKSLLKAWLNQRGGQVYTQRAKEGFGMPFGKWLQTGQLPWVIDALKKPHVVLYDWLDYPKFEQMLAAHQRKKRDYTSEIWAVVTLDYWLKSHF